jgi:hypothetical protein
MNKDDFQKWLEYHDQSITPILKPPLSMKKPAWNKSALYGKVENPSKMFQNRPSIEPFNK